MVNVSEVEIYGIPLEVYQCYGCEGARKLLNSNSIPYTFYDVVRKVDNDLGFEYDRPRIEELAKRAGFNSLRIVYPQIFVNGVHIGGYKHLKEILDDLG